MISTRHIVAWQPLLTDHQSHTLEALGAAMGADVTAIVLDYEDAVRRAQGWTRAKVRSLSTVRLPPCGWRATIRHILREYSGAIHLFGSPFSAPKLMLALILATRRRAEVYLVSEPYADVTVGYLSDRPSAFDVIKARLRPLIYRGYGLAMRRRIAGVFAISPLAVAQYRAIGVSPDRVFPFGYFVPSPDLPEVEREPENDLRLVFVGGLIARKGVTELIAAVRTARTGGADLTADFYGAGDAARFGFDEVIARYRGRIAFGEAGATMARYDALVLPSRHDGWGVVVNEALQSGVPVICSDRVGAGAVVAHWGAGVVYCSADPLALANTLAMLARDKMRLEPMRAAARAAARCLTPAVAGAYMRDAIASAGGLAGRPVNPWYAVP
jgi:glycosyltransferase involved in cell wall biosynthesis